MGIMDTEEATKITYAQGTVEENMDTAAPAVRPRAQSRQRARVANLPVQNHPRVASHQSRRPQVVPILPLGPDLEDTTATRNMAVEKHVTCVPLLTNNEIRNKNVYYHLSHHVNMY